MVYNIQQLSCIIFFFWCVANDQLQSYKLKVYLIFYPEVEWKLGELLPSCCIQIYHGPIENQEVESNYQVQ